MIQHVHQRPKFRQVGRQQGRRIASTAQTQCQVKHTADDPTRAPASEVPASRPATRTQNCQHSANTVSKSNTLSLIQHVHQRPKFRQVGRQQGRRIASTAQTQCQVKHTADDPTRAPASEVPASRPATRTQNCQHSANTVPKSNTLSLIQHVHRRPKFRQVGPANKDAELPAQHKHSAKSNTLPMIQHVHRRPKFRQVGRQQGTQNCSTAQTQCQVKTHCR